MARLYELQPAELARIEQLFHEKVFSRIHHGFHHHVCEARRFHEIDDLPAIFDARGHRHRAGNVFAGLQRLQRLHGMVGNWSVDMNGMHAVVLQQIVVSAVTPLDFESIADGIEFLFAPLADRIHVRRGMALINRDELRAESKSGNCDVDFPGSHSRGGSS